MTFFIYLWVILPSWFRIRIQQLKLLRIHADPDPDELVIRKLGYEQRYIEIAPRFSVANSKSEFEELLITKGGVSREG